MDLLKVAKSSYGCFPRHVRAPGMGFSCETGGNWYSKKKSKVLHLDYMAYTQVPLV